MIVLLQHETIGMLRRVYIETTIPSFYFTLRKDAESVARRNWTRQWWSEFEGSVELASSVAVINELQRGSGSTTADRINLLAGIELLEITEEVTKLSEIYVSRLVMPPRYSRRCAAPRARIVPPGGHSPDLELSASCQSE